MLSHVSTSQNSDDKKNEFAPQLNFFEKAYENIASMLTEGELILPAKKPHDAHLRYLTAARGFLPKPPVKKAQSTITAAASATSKDIKATDTNDESSDSFLSELQNIPKEESPEDLRLDRLYNWLTGKCTDSKIDTNYIIIDITTMLSEKKPYRFRPGIAKELTEFLNDLVKKLKNPFTTQAEKDNEAKKLLILIRKRASLVLFGQSSEILVAIERENEQEDTLAKQEENRFPAYLNLAANILDALLKQNKKKHIDKKADNQELFYDKEKYSQKTVTLLNQIAKSLKLPSNATYKTRFFPYKDLQLYINPDYFIFMLIYIKRYLAKHKKTFINSWNVRSILITSFSIAYAMLEDHHAPDPQQIIALPNRLAKEATFLAAMDFNAMISSEEYHEFKFKLAMEFIHAALEKNGFNKKTDYTISALTQQLIEIKFNSNSNKHCSLIKNIFPQAIENGLHYYLDYEAVLEMQVPTQTNTNSSHKDNDTQLQRKAYGL